MNQGRIHIGGVGDAFADQLGRLDHIGPFGNLDLDTVNLYQCH